MRPGAGGADLGVLGHSGEGVFNLDRELRTQVSGLTLVEERSLPDVRLSRTKEDEPRHRLSSARISARASAAEIVSISPARYC